MNKSELVDHVAESADIPKATAARAVEAALEGITSSLSDGESVALVGFGTFLVRERAARAGRNPKTGEAIQIAAIFPDNKVYDEEFSVHFTFASRKDRLFFLRLFCLGKIRPQ